MIIGLTLRYLFGTVCCHVEPINTEKPARGGASVVSCAPSKMMVSVGVWGFSYEK